MGVSWKVSTSWAWWYPQIYRTSCGFWDSIWEGTWERISGSGGGRAIAELSAADDANKEAAPHHTVYSSSSTLQYVLQMLSHEPQVLYYWQTYHFVRLNELFKTSTIMATLKYDLAPKRHLCATTSTVCSPVSVATIVTSWKLRDCQIWPLLGLPSSSTILIYLGRRVVWQYIKELHTVRCPESRSDRTFWTVTWPLLGVE